MNPGKRLFACAVSLVLLSCSPEPEPEPAPSGPTCEAPVVTGRLPRELREASGIAPGSDASGIAWVLTDGGAPTLFALDSTGAVVARVSVTGATKTDWESLASARCGDRSCLYIGDIGDNLRSRATVRVYRVPEPDPRNGATATADAFEFRYPDGAHDAEAMFVLPGEQLYIVTKGRSEPVSVYRAGALRAGETVVLELVQPLSASFVQLPDMVTGAGATADGEWVVLRTYSGVQLYRLLDGVLQPQLPGVGIDLQALREFQGEGVDLRADGTILLVSEKGLDDGDAPISRMRCKLKS
jgi:hypothetical protein